MERHKKLCETYAQRGVVVVRHLFARTEIDTLCKEAMRLWDELRDRNEFNLRVGLRKNLENEDVLERLDPVVDISTVFHRVNTDRRLTELAERLLNEPVTVLKEKLIYKWPGTSGYAAHRDEPYFSSSGAGGHEMLSVALALDKADEMNGAIVFYPTLGEQELDAATDEPRDISLDVLDDRLEIQPRLNPGDVVAFNGLVPHRSDFNRSQRCRRTYTVTFIPKRYLDGRRRYYRARHQEQEALRSKHLRGRCYFS